MVAARKIETQSKPQQTAIAQAMNVAEHRPEGKGRVLIPTNPAVPLSASELRSKVLMAYKATNLSDAASDGLAVQRGKALLDLFNGATQETVKEALNGKKAKLAGFSASDMTVLYESSAIYRGYLADSKHVEPMMIAESVTLPDGSEIHGWRSRVDAIRAFLSDKREAVSIAKASVERALTDTGTLSPEAIAEATETVQAEREAEAEAKAEARASPQFVGRAAAKRIIGSLDGMSPRQVRDWINVYRAAFDGYVTEWRGEHSAELVDEGSLIEKEKATA